MLKLDLEKMEHKYCLKDYADETEKIHQMIREKKGLGNEYLGWVDLPVDYDKNEFKEIKKIATKLKKELDVLLVCGIGGSYLGARAAIESINGLYPTNDVEIIFVGNTFSSTYLAQVKEYVKDKEFAINVISKSGTTTETAIAFRVFKELAEAKYGKEKAKERVFATTDKNRGSLKKLSLDEGYTTFVIPENVGGRFSILTAVGLFPIAVAGINIDEMMQGARHAALKYNDKNILTNDAYKYGLIRQLLFNDGYVSEMFVSYEMQFAMLAEWWKQLFGESEGKSGKGILPTSATFSTDLHSLGQFIQDGNKILFETLLQVKEPLLDLNVPFDKDDLDNLNYLAGKSVDYVNKKACEGTIAAHVETGHVPNILITVDKLDAYGLGYLVYFFEMACTFTVYYIGENPFNQPGVEVYKSNMFKLLGKPER